MTRCHSMSWLVLGCLALAAQGPVWAAQSQPASPLPLLLTPPALCDAAIAGAEVQQRLPARVLRAIAQRESGRLDPSTGRVRPWPWTINYQGTGHFFETREDAIAAVRDIQASGGQSIDVGCMQVNLMHHPNAFSSLEDAFDPISNAAYAGRFLKSLFAASNDWGQAIAAYHSRTPEIGAPYRDQVLSAWNPTDPTVLARLSPSPIPPLAVFPVAYFSSMQGTSSTIPVWAPVAAGPVVRLQKQDGGQYRVVMASLPDPGLPAKGKPRRSAPLDLRVGTGPVSGPGGLVVPGGVAVPGVRPPAKPTAVKPAAPVRPVQISAVGFVVR